MPHNCPACGTVNDDWRPFCTKCSLRLDGARHGVPGTAGSALEHYAPLGDNIAAKPAKGRVRTATAVVVLGVLAGLTFGGVALARHLDNSGPAIEVPRNWDPRLAPLVAVTEHLRGLHFKHPVSARFYPDAAFNKLNTEGLDKPKTRTELVRIAAELRALGVGPARLDLTKAVKTLVSSTTLAFYDPKTKRISVRGSKLDVAHDVTIVHELTHALQDQYFDLHKLDKGNAKGESVDPLVEGDARDVEDRYVDTLSRSRKAEYDAQQKRLGASSVGEVASVPDVLVLSQQAPYDIGERFVHALRAVGGVDAVNRAFRSPPRSDWYFVDPAAYLEHAKEVKLGRPKLPDGTKFLEDQGQSGSLTLFLLLSERVDAHAALAASDAWRGDHTILYAAHHTVCVDIDVAAHDRAGRDSIESALRAWSARMPRHETSVVRRSDEVVEVRACDAGPHTPALTHHALQAYMLPVSRLDLLDAFLDDGADPASGWCASDQVVYSYSVAAINDPSGRAFRSPEFAQRLRGWVRACRASTSTSQT